MTFDALLRLLLGVDDKARTAAMMGGIDRIKEAKRRRGVFP